MNDRSIARLIAATLFLAMTANAQTLSFSSPNVVTSSYFSVKKLKVVDLDADGDKDIVVASSATTGTDPNVSWFENTGSGWVQRDLTTSYPLARTVDVGDIDADGKLDIVAANRDTDPITWWEAVNYATNSWSGHTEGTECIENHDVELADLNSDGYLDIISARAFQAGGGENCVTWYENNPSNPGTFTQRVISVANRYRLIAVHVADVDGDGDQDILACDSGDFFTLDEDVIFLLENDGNENFTYRDVVNPISHPIDIFAGDIDKDGDMDIAAVTWGTDSEPIILHDVFWLENDGKPFSDGSKTWTRYEVGTDFYTARTIFTVDLDGDDDLDMVGVASDADGTGTGGYISYFINDGTPANGNWARTDLINNFNYAYHAQAVDMDGDGDLDIVGSAQTDEAIYWWENLIDDAAQNIVTNTQYELWNSQVMVEVSSGASGSETLSMYFTAESVPDRGALGIGIDHLATNGFYTFKTDMSSYTADLRFSYGGISEWSAVDNESDLRIVYFDGADWVIPNQTLDAAGDSITVNGFSAANSDGVRWTLASVSADNSLPVQLMAFSAAPEADGVRLRWATASEVNNLGFEVWRANARDSLYRKIDSYIINDDLRGAGNSNTRIDYTLTDSRVERGETYYYLLTDIDFSGQVAEHGPVRVTYRPEPLAFSFELRQNYPNPFNGVTRIPFWLSGPAGRGDLKIFNMLGAEVRSFSLIGLGAGTREVVWDAMDNNGRQVASGQYVVLLKVNGRVQTRQMVYIR